MTTQTTSRTTTDPTTDTTPTPPPPRRAAGRPGWFGALLLRLHFYAGLLVGPFILVAAVSGALYALTPALEQVVYRHELTAPVTSTRLSLADQVEIARDHVGDPGATPSAVRPAPGPGDTTRVMFADARLGESESRAVLVDPGTGEVRGDLTVYGTSGALPLRTWLDQLHRNLHLGEPGRLYSELAASWLGVVALAGLGLWVARVRRSRARKDFVRPARGRRGYRALFTWHTSVGFWVVLGALFLSATGITWSQYAGGNVDTLRGALDWGTPAVDTDLPGGDAQAAGAGEHAGHGAAGPGGAPVGEVDPALFDAVLATAQAVNVNTGLVEITPPAAPGSAWVVQEIQRSYPTEVDAVAVDPATLRAVHRVDFSEFPLAAKLARWGIDAHMGSLFGLPHQLALFVLASGIAALVVLGYLMWWRRRPTPLRGGPPPERDVLRGAPWWGVAAVLAGAVLVGWWLPLVGWTLAGFVVLDVLLGLRRSGTTSGVTPPGAP
ncbi:PepSY-associated TM helix domain-containing protein [Promicromonospora thailandica]|uniref:Iron-regulated membrane protein n=1 Tax=Promicromonospora thailandica TaxID=765201 RepID=A0A9X2G550_9MICO|nr:PepSY-associated TM helix domain-containing protein [Promicromonospora thailandica]MCP2266969.1 putative iron-regulated membrane protein [Promicromonospora thailandica]